MKIQSEAAANKALSEHKILKKSKPKTKPPLTVQEMHEQLKSQRPKPAAQAKGYAKGGRVKGKRII